MNDLATNDDVAAWRRDPESSFSDWTIRIVQDSSNNDVTTTREEVDDPNIKNDCERVKRSHNIPFAGTNESPVSEDNSKDPKAEAFYHVHRVYIASGPRKSEYFETLFSLPTATTESSSKMTTLALSESSCSVFPLLLDFVYDGEKCGLSASSVDTNIVTPIEAVALVFLADYLRIPKLVPVASNLVSKILNESNVHIIICEAMFYGIDWIVNDCIGVASLSPRDFFPSATETEELEKSTEELEKSPVLQTLEALPIERQNELLKLSLSHSLRELGRFRRVPSRWKADVADVNATHMPTLMLNGKNTDGEYRLPAQGCGIPFPKNKICPLFYFDGDDTIEASSPVRAAPVSSPFYPSNPPFEFGSYALGSSAPSAAFGSSASSSAFGSSKRNPRRRR